MKGIGESAVEPGAPASASGFYLHSMACIGVIFPREAEGSGMVLVYPGFSGELALPLATACVPRAGTGRTGPRDESFGFLVPAVQRDPERPGETRPPPILCFPPTLTVGLS